MRKKVKFKYFKNSLNSNFYYRSQSVDNELHRIKTPSKRTPVFGSIERGLDKVKTIFTPRKRLNTIETPRKAKVLGTLKFSFEF